MFFLHFPDSEAEIAELFCSGGVRDSGHHTQALCMLGESCTRQLVRKI